MATFSAFSAPLREIFLKSGSRGGAETQRRSQPLRVSVPPREQYVPRQRPADSGRQSPHPGLCPTWPFSDLSCSMKLPTSSSRHAVIRCQTRAFPPRCRRVPGAYPARSRHPTGASLPRASHPRRRVGGALRALRGGFTDASQALRRQNSRRHCELRSSRWRDPIPASPAPGRAALPAACRWSGSSPLPRAAAVPAWRVGCRAGWRAYNGPAGCPLAPAARRDHCRAG